MILPSASLFSRRARRPGGRPAVCLLLVFLLLILLAELPRAPEAAQGRRLRLFYSTDFLGNLEPCG